MEQVILRKANVDEGKVLTDLALRSKSHWNYSQEYLANCRLPLAIDRQYIDSWPVTVATIGEAVLGFSALKNVAGERRLDHLWIEPDHLRMGTGKMLFSQAIKDAKGLGWSSFRIAAEPMSVGFYQKMNVEEIGTVQSRIKPDLFLPHLEYKIY